MGSALPIGLAWPEDDVIAPLFGVDKVLSRLRSHSFL